MSGRERESREIKADVREGRGGMERCREERRNGDSYRGAVLPIDLLYCLELVK